MRPNLALLVVFLLIPSAACETFFEIDIVVPAVSQDPSTAVMIGVPVRLNVKMITPGTGEIFVNTRALTEMDMQGSARLAAIVAGDVTGEDVDGVDFLVTLYSNSTIIGGPSAGAAMTVAMSALLEGLELREDAMMTGMITLDGAVGVVGGIPEKASAAYKSGATVFLVPEGQSVSYNSTTYEDVNVTEMAMEKWNLTVIEISDIREAITIFTGREFRAREYPTTPVAMESYLALMKVQSEDGLEEANESLAAAGQVLDSLSANLTEDLADTLETDLNLSADRLVDAYAAHESEQYYVATSKAFQSRITSRFVANAARYYSTDPPDRHGIISGIWEEASLSIEEAESHVNGTRIRGITGMECHAAAQGRIEEARMLLEESRTWYDLDLEEDALFQASYSIERAFTAITWADIAAFFPWGPEPGGDDLMLIAQGLYADASILAAYADLLYEEIFGLPISWVVALIPDYGFIDPYESLDRAEDGLDEGKWSMATFEALESETRSGLAIEFINVLVLAEDMAEAADMMESIANKSRVKCRLSIEDSRRIGVEPVISVSRYEFSEDLAESGEMADLGEAIFGYRYGTSVARLSPSLLALYQPVLALVPINASFLSGDWALRGSAQDPNDDEMRITAKVGDVTVESSIPSGPFSLVIPTSQLPDGPHPLTVNLSDGSLFDFHSFNVTIDNTPPVITVAGLRNGTIYDQTILPAVSVSDAVDADPDFSMRLDGKEYANGTIGEGRHLFEVEAVDWAGWSSRTLLNVSVDLSPPVVQAGRPAENGTWTAGPLRAEWVAYDNVTGVSTSHWRVDSGSWREAERINVTSQDPDALSWFGAAVTASDGEHFMSIRAVDLSGRNSTLILRFTLDGSSPGIEILGVENSSWYNSPVTPSYSVADAVDEEPVVTATLDGVPFSSGNAVGPGRHELRVSAVDRAGNGNQVSLVFTVDTLAPNIWSNITDGSVYSGPISVAHRVEDDLDPDPSSSVILDGEPYDGSIVPHGEHILEIAASDSAGNHRTLTLAFVADISPPTISPSVEDGIWYRDSPRIVVDFQDDLPEQLVTRVLLDGAEYDGATLDDGRYILVAWAADPAGNNVSVSVDFYIDSHEPEIEVTGLEDGGTYGRWVTPQISINDLDEAPQLTILLDGEPYDPEGPIRDGRHEMRISAVDRVGNSEEIAVGFTIDTVPPVVTIDLVDGGTYSGAVTPQVKVEEGEEDVELEMILDGSPYEAGTRIGPGSHVLVVEATDSAGNLAKEKIAFTVRWRFPTAIVVLCILLVAILIGILVRRRGGPEKTQVYRFRG